MVLVGAPNGDVVCDVAKLPNEKAGCAVAACGCSGLLACDVVPKPPNGWAASNCPNGEKKMKFKIQIDTVVTGVLLDMAGCEPKPKKLPVVEPKKGFCVFCNNVLPVEENRPPPDVGVVVVEADPNGEPNGLAADAVFVAKRDPCAVAVVVVGVPNVNGVAAADVAAVVAPNDGKTDLFCVLPNMLLVFCRRSCQ